MDYTENIYISNIIFQNINFEINDSNVNFLCFLSKLYSKSLDYLTDYLENIDKEKLNSLLNKHDENKMYAIHYLCINKDFNIDYLKLYLKYNNTLSFDNENRNLIYYLIKYNNLSTDIIEYLISINYNFYFLDTDVKFTIYHYLANNLNEINEYCLDIIFNHVKNDFINKKNLYETAPILIATRLNNKLICNKLIDYGCNVNIKNNNNNTCLMYACMNSNYKLAKKLIENKADINAIDNQKDMPLFYACGCDNKSELDLDLIKYLVDKGAKLDCISEDNNTPLHYASQYFYHYEIIKYLLSLDINPNILNKENKTFIEYIDNTNEVIYFLENFNLIKYKNIKNSILIKYGKDPIFDNFFDIEPIELDSKERTCLICKSEFESKIVKCENNHCFDLDCILEWYNTENKSCPFCFKNIDIFKIYKLK